MAKRKRLGAADPARFGAPAPEVKGAMHPGNMTGATRAPIADVASDAASSAALSEMTRAMDAARDGGRMVVSLPLAEITLDHLVRDRVVIDDAEMEALRLSMASRGQQTPVEVMPLAQGGYGLISGWRRCQALAQLTEAGAHDGTVLALLRQPGDASDAYLAMVEENEIRVGLSYFERARIAAKAVDQGVFETEKAALLSLFRAASRAKRSKIRSFLPVVRALDGVVRFPGQIGERLGLRLGAALDQTPELAQRIRDQIALKAPGTPEAEGALLAKMLGQNSQKQSLKAGLETESKSKPALRHHQLRPGLSLEWEEEGDRLTLSGTDMTPELRARLMEWLRSAG